MTKSVAIYGFSTKCRDQIHESEADEIWTVNNGYKHGVPRIDRLYEMHQYWQLTDPNIKPDHWEWLQQEHDFPIYMYDGFLEVPNAVRYPIEDIAASIYTPRLYFTSSISYLVAHALYENVERVELYGVDLDSSTEYAYQKAGTEYLLGVAIGRGVDVYIADGSSLLAAPLYIYDVEAQMINRQTIEKQKQEYKLKFEAYQAQHNMLAGQYNLLFEMEEKTDAIVEQMTDLFAQVQHARDNMNRYEGGVRTCQFQLDHIDMKVPGYEMGSGTADIVYDVEPEEDNSGYYPDGTPVELGQDNG